MSLDGDQTGMDAGRGQAAFKCRAVLVLTCTADNRHQRTERGDVHGYIGGAARLMTAVGCPHHRHGSLGRDALDISPDVAIEHQVADHEDVDLLPAALNQSHDASRILDHCAAIPASRQNSSAKLMKALIVSRTFGTSRILAGSYLQIIE
jgi:hypothetical protein